ncbi:hypothetical protein [Kocuria turfanensis]|uniref:hypothetical protein n=1 Tax=Kocuria turfanensis TaxID=388357 RepID=UPI0011BE8945|nr:hypothetical protein [Kocuria turfanensis]
MTRPSRRPSAPGAVLVPAVLCLLALTGCGTGQQQGFVLEPVPGPTTPAPAPPGDSPGPETCFDVAGAYTALMLVPLSTDGPHPGFDPGRAADSVQQLAPGMPADLRPAFDTAVADLRAAGDSLQPVELAGLQRTLAPVDDWLQRRCGGTAPPTDRPN